MLALGSKGIKVYSLNLSLTIASKMSSTMVFAVKKGCLSLFECRDVQSLLFFGSKCAFYMMSAGNIGLER